MTHIYSIDKDTAINESYRQGVKDLDNNQFAQVFNSYMNQKDYDKMWYVLTEATNNPKVNVVNFKKIMTEFFGKKYEGIKSSNMVINFLDGFAYFLEKQTKFSHQELIPLFAGYENNFFVEAIKNKQFQHVETFSKCRSSTRFPLYKEAIVSLMEGKKREEIQTVLPYLTGLNTNNSEILRLFYTHSFYYYDIIKDVIDKFELDINATGTTGKVDRSDNSQRTWAFTHAVFSHAAAQNKKIFTDFLTDYGKKIDLDTNFSYLQRDYQGNNPTWRHRNCISVLWNSDLSIQEKCNRLEEVIQKCNLTEKNIAQITNLLISNSISHSYSHSIYDTLFDHPIFKSSKVDKGAVLITILNMDKDSSVKNIIEQNNNMINPVTIVAEKLFAHYSDIKTDIHPFVAWATDNKKFFKDSFDYLFNKYEKDIKTLPLSYLQVLPNSIKAELSNKGIVGLKKMGFFSRMFKGEEPVVTIVQPVINDYIAQSTHLEFNSSLFDRVGDSQISFYIESIKLNAEQFEAQHDGIVSKNSHYMINLLPKFLNKIVEHYLSLHAIEPDEAKENTLIQLKLLNKKSVDILNDVLQEEKDKINNKVNIQKTMMKNY